MQHKLIVASVGLVLAVSGTANGQRATAQSTDDTRWYPWIGCWQRSGDSGALGQFTCVRPGSDASADILTIADGAVESREHLVVDGLPHPIDADGCHGSQTATWSATEGGSRLYIGSAYSCSGGLRGRSTRMFAILPSGVWLEVRDVHAGGGWVETVTRFHDAGLPASIPANVRSEISHRGLAVATARAAASAPVSAADIAEATRSVDTVVVQSWLTARGQAIATESNVASNSVPPTVRIFYGTPPSSEPPPQPEYSQMEPACPAFQCVDGYSAYNGYPYSPFGYPYSPFVQPGVFGFNSGFPFVSPVVVIRGGSRGPVRPRQQGGSRPGGSRPWGARPGGTSPGGPRPPGFHTPGGGRPLGQGPVVSTPVSHMPTGQAARGGMSSRGRP
jgi:hypothetical protein